MAYLNIQMFKGCLDAFTITLYHKIFINLLITITDQSSYPALKPKQMPMATTERATRRGPVLGKGRCDNPEVAMDGCGTWRTPSSWPAG